MAITVVLQVYQSVEQVQVADANQDVRVVVPNVYPQGTVGEQIKSFVHERLGVPLERQELTGPQYEELCDSQPASYLSHAFLCEPTCETSNLYIDEDSLSLWGVHTASQIELHDDDRLAEKHLVDQAVLRLCVRPEPLDEQDGGRVFVETRSGVLPLLGIRPTTRVQFLKEMLFSLLGIPVAHQIISSAGCIMHDDQQMAHFEGLHAVYTDSVLDLCCTGEPLSEQAHRRMVVHACVLDGREVSVVVSGKNRVRDVMTAVENRTGLPAGQQKVTYNGKTLEDGWSLHQVAACHQCVMHIAPHSSLLRSISYGTSSEGRVQLFHPELLSPSGGDRDTEGSANGMRKKQKIKLMRIKDGRLVGTLKLTFASGETVADVRKRLGRHLRPLTDQNANETSRDTWDAPMVGRSEVRLRTLLRKSATPPPELQPLGTPSPPNKLTAPEVSKSDAEFRFVKPPVGSEKSLGHAMSLSAWKRRQDRLDAMRRSVESGSAQEDASRLKVQDWLVSDVPTVDCLASMPLEKEGAGKDKHRWARAKSKILRAFRLRKGS